MKAQRLSRLWRRTSICGLGLSEVFMRSEVDFSGLVAQSPEGSPPMEVDICGKHSSTTLASTRVVARSCAMCLALIDCDQQQRHQPEPRGRMMYACLCSGVLVSVDWSGMRS